MGELLRFPDRSAATEGVEQRSAPSRRAAAARHPAAQQTLDDIERVAGPDARRRAEQALPPAAADEPAWAVPGVDDVAPAPIAAEPTGASKRAANVALAALTRHDASEGEIRAKLVAKGLEEPDVEAELDRLRGVGLIDDAAFAIRLVERLRERKGLGDQAIRSTLRGRLVPQGVIDAVLVDQAEDEEAAEARLQEVADDRARRLGSLPYAVAERRLTAYLMRKGYSGSSVRAATRAALDGAGIR
ncbi:regulatory protein RecX [uncultured Amnibacterium sp.]|uniref:regulatory protein RecX n=1 Tax=uncultured Amnibacterium sp. TaxID=1631851 RepID=UPI0035CB7E52